MAKSPVAMLKARAATDDAWPPGVAFWMAVMLRGLVMMDGMLWFLGERERENVLRFYSVVLNDDGIGCKFIIIFLYIYWPVRRSTGLYLRGYSESFVLQEIQYCDCLYFKCL